MDKTSLKKEVYINFVIPEDCANEEEVNDCMKMAFQECVEADLSPKWLTAAECFHVSGTKNTVFVLQNFTGDTFEKLRSVKSVRVCGPMCLRSCVAEGLPIPENKSPVFTIAMRGLIVTASQVPTSTKAHIKQQVGFMGGVYMSNLVEAVTHLVTNAVRSTKYEVAGEKGIPAMTVAWVDAVWEESLKRNIRATDPQFMERYKCPIFLDMVITCSNLPKREKDKIKELVTQNGGTYSRQLRQNETTLLVITEPHGEKYKHARSWDLPCVRPSYIIESVHRGYAVPSKGHLVEPSASCSTPTKDDGIPNFTCYSDSVSVINFDPSKTQIDETQLTNCSIMTTQPRENPRSAGSQHAQIVENLSVSDAKKAGSFVDGCKIFLSGFTSVEAEKLRRILSLGGATVFSDMSESVSHFLIGEFMVQDMKGLAAVANKPHVVTVDWLAACIKQRIRVCEEPFYCLESRKVVPEPPSPLSQKGMQLLQPPQAIQCEMPPPAEPPVRKLFSEFVKENAKSPAKQPVSVKQQTTMNSTASSQDTTIPEIFSGLKFLVVGFDEGVSLEIEAAIEAAAGCVESGQFTGVVDYAVVPVLQTTVPRITSVEVVTNLWLEDCLDKAEVVPVDYYHQPFFVDNKKPLADYCISLSNYFSKEKNFLIEVTKTLGATYQDIFARVAKEDKGALASTHLVCPRPEGQKYNAAIRWGLPAVNKDWLLACARMGAKVEEAPYLVQDIKGTSCVIEQKSKIGSTPSRVTSSPRLPPSEPSTPVCTSITPASSKQVTPAVVSSLRVPPINSACPGSSMAPPISPMTPVSVTTKAPTSLKRKSCSLTSEESSPFHVATPNTPYGQVFGTPTAETKKRWKRFIDDLPCKAKSPPLPQKVPRRQSTPLSELKRQIWETALEISNENANPNLSIEELDEHENQDRQNVHTPSNSNNFEPRRVSVGRSTPMFDDFMANKSKTPVSKAKSSEMMSRSETDQTVKKPPANPANEMVSAMLGQLHKRLSTTANTTEEPQPLPQRELVSPAEKKPASDKPVATSSLLPESQPILIGWEDPVESAERAKAMASPATSGSNERIAVTRKFIFSNVMEKEKYEEMLKNLGETVILTATYDNQTTHLIMDEPVRSEKLLCCLAAGKWILHTSYIDEMAKHRKYLPVEERYEWGNPLSAGTLPTLQLNSMEHQLASAATRWRKKISSGTGGAFSNMRAVLIASPNKYESYKRLIMAGSGDIVPATSILNATHCFVEINKVSTMSVPLSQFAAQKIPCLLPIFLSDMLIKFPPPNVQDGLIPEYRRLLDLSDKC